VTLIPIGTVVEYAPVCARVGDGIVCSVIEESLGSLYDKVRSMRLDAAGNVLWSQPLDACTVASDKLRLVTASSPSGVTLLAWTDKRADAGNVVAQDVNPDGTLGDHTGSVTPYGCSNPAGSLGTAGRPAIGGTFTLLVDNPLGTQTAGSLAVLVLALQRDPNYPCGTLMPGLGMSGPGEVLLQAPLISLIGGFWSGPLQPVPFALPIPWNPALAGFQLHAQGMLLDLSPSTAVPIGLTTAVRFAIGF
jgi:hypothetical protein